MWVIIRQLMSGDCHLSSDTCLQTLVRAVVALTLCPPACGQAGGLLKMGNKEMGEGFPSLCNLGCKLDIEGVPVHQG